MMLSAVKAEPDLIGASEDVGPFARAARSMRACGLVPLPMGDEDGKRPLVSFGKWKRLPGEEFLDSLISKFGSSNIGVELKLSGYTVIDCDSHEASIEMLKRCGDTPLKIATPSGGSHLWYQSSGERCTDLRREGLEVDVKGIGGVVVAPPSFRRNGAFKYRAYTFAEGDWNDLGRVPRIREGGIWFAAPVEVRTKSGLVEVGTRNKSLFDFLRGESLKVDRIEDLRTLAAKFNTAFSNPLSDGEVEKTVASVWRYRIRGDILIGGEPRFVVTRSALDQMEDDPDALLLLARLTYAHGARASAGEPLAAPPKKLSEIQMIKGWGHDRYRHALQRLVDRGFLRIVHLGGARAGDPRLYVFANLQKQGSRNSGQYNKTPPPSLPLVH